jgi:hypothetical protein
MRPMNRPVWTAALLLVSALGLAAQQITGGGLLLTTVVDAQGRPIVDLELDDFVIKEAGATREVIDVHVADYPLVLLLDGRVEPATWTAIKSAAARFIARVGERPIVIGTLASGVLGSLEDERRTVNDRLAGLQPAMAGAAEALAAVSSGAAVLKATESPFSAIVVVASRPIDASEQVRSDLLPGIVASNATVHVIEAQSAPREAGAAPVVDLLEGLAAQTRGQRIGVFSPSSYGIALERLADRLATEMMVQYLSPGTSAMGDVTVGVRRPGARVIGLGVR